MAYNVVRPVAAPTLSKPLVGILRSLAACYRANLPKSDQVCNADLILDLPPTKLPINWEQGPTVVSYPTPGRETPITSLGTAQAGLSSYTDIQTHLIGLTTAIVVGPGAEEDEALTVKAAGWLPEVIAALTANTALAGDVVEIIPLTYTLAPLQWGSKALYFALLVHLQVTARYQFTRA